MRSKDVAKLQDYYRYLNMERYRGLGYTCLVLLSFSIVVKDVEINIINGLNNLYIYNAKAT